MKRTNKRRTGDVVQYCSFQLTPQLSNFPQSVSEWDKQLMVSYAKFNKEEDAKVVKTGKELDKRLGNFKSLLAHLNSPSDDDVLRGKFFCSRSTFASVLLWLTRAGLKAFKYSVEKLRSFLKKRKVFENFFKQEGDLKRLSSDALNKYLEKSPEFHEIFKIWQNVRNNQQSEVHVALIDLLGSIYQCLKAMGVNKERSLAISPISRLHLLPFFLLLLPCGHLKISLPCSSLFHPSSRPPLPSPSLPFLLYSARFLKTNGASPITSLR